MEYWKYPLHLIKITTQYHQGKCIDFKWDSNYGGEHVPIYSIADGVVTASQVYPSNIGAGECVRIKHNNGYESVYAHLQTGSRKVSVGQKVKMGQQIGNMGDTGRSDGCHLHFGIYSPNIPEGKRWNESDIDPYAVLYKYPDQVIYSEMDNTIKNAIKVYSEDTLGPSKVFKYVYNVGDEGLIVRNAANGSATGELIKTGALVEVFETSGNWSRIGTNRWVHSNYLTDLFSDCNCYQVSGADSDGLNVRNKPSSSGRILNCLPNGSRVQIYATSGTWAKVSKTEERWCSKNYLTPVVGV